MYRRQYKILTLICLLLILSVVILDNNIQLISQMRWKLTYYFEIDELEEWDDYFPINTTPNTDDIQPDRPWYLSQGVLRPFPSSKPGQFLFPDPKSPYDDRILRQLMYVPADYGPDTSHKLILMYDYLGSWLPHEEGPDAFGNCPVNKCILTTRKDRLAEANAVLFDNRFELPYNAVKPAGQVWIIYMLESPANTILLEPSDMFNWTITYRPDSDLPAPYDRWIYYEPQHRKQTPQRNYATNKTRLVAWFVSNCNTHNLRYRYAIELRKYIQLDIFGGCGEKRCSRDEEDKCFRLLAKKYKFYLAFENSNCNYYITEKLFKNALRNNVVPIVMGARREDYYHAAPANSFIHVDDFSSPRDLANYLQILNENDTLYNEYFKWKGSGEFINHRLFCRLCTMLHSDFPEKYYKDINQWWRYNHMCEYTAKMLFSQK